MSQRLKPEYDEPLSYCAFNFNLRRYIKENNGLELIYTYVKP
jgi:hypothetical protein